MELINSLRAAANLSVLKFDESLNKAAQAHANYATGHHSMTHIEGKEKAGFSGALPSQRAEAFGYPNISVGEVIAPTFDEPARGTQVLIDAPFHRATLLSPNPLSYYKQQGAKVGYSISISTSYGNKLIHHSAAITDASGNPVDFYLVDANKQGADEIILLIPKKPLQGKTTYTVTAIFGETNSFNEEKGIPASEFTKTWSFTTTKAAAAATNSKTKQTRPSK